MHSGEDKPREEACLRTRRWNTEENSRSVLARSLSLLMTCGFSLSSKYSRLSFHTLFLSLDNYLQSVIANKLSCLWTKTGFCAFINFSHGEITTGSNCYLHASTHSSTWWYRGLFGTIMVQPLVSYLMPAIPREINHIEIDLVSKLVTGCHQIEYLFF